VKNDRHALIDRARLLLALHRPGDPLVLVNAWDVASAGVVVAAGVAAVATSSAAVAASLGEPDDDCMDVDLVFDVIRRISAAVAVPVTADIESGYGLDPDELIGRLLAAGAVGCNVEDSDHGRPGQQVAPDAFAERLAGIREAAAAVGVPVVLNARIDTFLLGGAGPDAVADVLARGHSYLAAGADCVYPIRLTDPAVVADLAAGLGGPLNANVAPGAPISALARAGASRVSVGPRGQRAAMEHLATFANEVLHAVP
jgi:2-methylisocitrate lyase-like PEP mutase family enzyme